MESLLKALKPRRSYDSNLVGGMLWKLCSRLLDLSKTFYYSNLHFSRLMADHRSIIVIENLINLVRGLDFPPIRWNRIVSIITDKNRFDLRPSTTTTNTTTPFHPSSPSLYTLDPYRCATVHNIYYNFLRYFISRQPNHPSPTHTPSLYSQLKRPFSRNNLCHDYS